MLFHVSRAGHCMQHVCGGSATVAASLGTCSFIFFERDIVCNPASPVPALSPFILCCLCVCVWCLVCVGVFYLAVLVALYLCFALSFFLRRSRFFRVRSPLLFNSVCVARRCVSAAALRIAGAFSFVSAAFSYHRDGNQCVFMLNASSQSAPSVKRVDLPRLLELRPFFLRKESRFFSLRSKFALLKLLEIASKSHSAFNSPSFL